MSIVTRWERRAEWPLTGAALVFLVAYAWPIIDPHLRRPWIPVAHGATWLAWSVFVVDYLIRLWLADFRRSYALHHLLDLAIIVLPMLRPLRLLRLVLLLRVLNRTALASLRGRIALYVVSGASILAFCGALAVLDEERKSPAANIHGFGDAMWWAVSTMTTVGYGDHYPITPIGRLAATGVMIGGVALLGVVTATLASWLVEHISDVEHRQSTQLRHQLDDVQRQLDEVLRLVAVRPARD